MKRPSENPLCDITNKKKPPKKSKSQESVSEIVEILKTPPLPRFSYIGIDQIPVFADVKETLMQAGYVFRDGLFCLPGKEPLENKDSMIKGVDYFESEEEFRAHLCVSGIPLGNGQRARGTDNHQQLSLLEAWVSYHRVAKMLGGRPVSSIRKISEPAARALLHKTGIACISKKWHIPGRADKFENEDMHEELAMNGIPPECNLNSLDEEERLSLELYIGAPNRRMKSLFNVSRIES